MIDLHLVSWNRPKMTELVIRTIHRNTSRDQYRLAVLDNGSAPEAQQMLIKLQAEGLIDTIDQRSENIGLERARQELLTRETYEDYFVDIDNDCLPPENWLEDQLALIQKYEGYAAISQRTQVMIGTGNIFEDETKELTDFPHPGGSFRLMRTEAVRDVGGWDREASGRGAEERYICGKLREAGYKTAFATHIQCLHLFGVRTQTQERWGYDESMRPEDSGHSDIWHPALGNGDEFAEVARYSGEDLAKEYFHVVGDHS